MEKHLVVIDTGAYSGNFERHMCAYITGIPDDGWEGGRIANKFNKGNPLLDWWGKNLLEVPYTYDIYVRMRKVALRYSVEFRSYNSVEFLVSSMPTEEQMAEIRKRAEDFCKNYAQILEISGEHTYPITDIPFVGVRVLTE